MHETEEWDSEEWKKSFKGRSDVPHRRYFKWRTMFSIISAFGWLIFLVIWLFFYASGYGLYQNLGIILASMIVIFGSNGLVWKEMNMESMWKSAFSGVTGLILGVFLVIWLFYYASDYTFLENVGVFFLSLLVIGALNSLIWIPKGSAEGWRAAVSAVTGIGWVIFLVYWLLMQSSNYTIYQNLAIFIVSILILAGINVVMWVPYGLKKAGKYF